MYDLDGWAHVASGKVRDLYVPQDSRAYGSGNVVLVVSSDRISAFDYVLPTTIPDKGKILNQLSIWWFHQLRDVTQNHVVSLDVPKAVEGRAIICRRLNMFPVECVVRGYLTGSGLVEYKASRSVCGIPLPGGLRESDELPSPIFTPASKAEMGDHDENITFDHAASRVGQSSAEELRRLSIELYDQAREVARGRGLILADTKFEFGTAIDSRETRDVILADEALTPDSSRYWDGEKWEPGRQQESFDKQFVRDWLLSPASGWDRFSGNPPPPLPDEIVERTRERYLEAYRRLTGEDPKL